MSLMSKFERSTDFRVMHKNMIYTPAGKPAWLELVAVKTSVDKETGERVNQEFNQGFLCIRITTKYSEKTGEPDRSQMIGYVSNSMYPEMTERVILGDYDVVEVSEKTIKAFAVKLEDAFKKYEVSYDKLKEGMTL